MASGEQAGGFLLGESQRGLHGGGCLGSGFMPQALSPTAVLPAQGSRTPGWLCPHPLWLHGCPLPTRALAYSACTCHGLGELSLA